MSGKNDLRYNKEGYYDETAYKAMCNLNRGGTYNMKSESVYRGEIWEMETQSGFMREVLIVQCFNTYAAVLTLVDQKPQENSMAIKSKALMWVDCGRMGYVFYDKLNSMIRSLTDAELDEVLYRIGTALDIHLSTEASCNGVAADTVQKTAEEERNATQSEEGLPKEAAQMMMDSALELEGMTRERDTYKHLYETLLDKILS